MLHRSIQLSLVKLGFEIGPRTGQLSSTENEGEAFRVGNLDGLHGLLASMVRLPPHDPHHCRPEQRVGNAEGVCGLDCGADGCLARTNRLIWAAREPERPRQPAPAGRTQIGTVDLIERPMP